MKTRLAFKNFLKNLLLLSVGFTIIAVPVGFFTVNALVLLALDLSASFILVASIYSLFYLSVLIVEVRNYLIQDD